MTCTHCESDRLFKINSHHTDRFTFSYKGESSKFPDYAPRVDNICGGDDVNVCICLNCGTVQGEFPVNDDSILEQLEIYEED